MRVLPDDLCGATSGAIKTVRKQKVGYIFAISVYLTVIIPALRTIVTPIENVDTREDRIEAMRLLAAGNVIIILLLGLVLVLQVRHLYMGRSRADFVRGDKNMLRG
jgi:hypothetical protein